MNVRLRTSHARIAPQRERLRLLDEDNFPIETDEPELVDATIESTIATEATPPRMRATTKETIK